MKYICEKCGKEFDTYIACNEHEFSCGEIREIVLLTLDARINDKGEADVITQEGSTVYYSHVDGWDANCNIPRIDEDAPHRFFMEVRPDDRREGWSVLFAYAKLKLNARIEEQQKLLKELDRAERDERMRWK